MGLEIQRVAIASLIPDPTNARKHGKNNMDAIKGSLAKFGQVEPLVVNSRTGIVVGGNGRLAAMLELGYVDCDVVRLDLNAVEASALALTLNRTGELAEWDEDVLSKTLAALKSEGFGLLDIGFNLSDFDFPTPDYSAVGGEGSGGTNNLDDMRGEVRKAIQIEFDLEHYEEATELVKFWRSQGAAVGLMLIEKLKDEKLKVEGAA